MVSSVVCLNSLSLQETLALNIQYYKSQVILSEYLKEGGTIYDGRDMGLHRDFKHQPYYKCVFEELKQRSLIASTFETKDGTKLKFNKDTKRRLI